MTTPAPQHQISVSGMSCQGCVKAVERVIAKQDASAQFEVSLERAEATIASTVPVETFTAALTKAGYPAQSR